MTLTERTTMIGQPSEERVDELIERWKIAKGKLQNAQAAVAAAYDELDPVLREISREYGGAAMLIVISRKDLTISFMRAEDSRPASGYYIAGTTRR